MHSSDRSVGADNIPGTRQESSCKPPQGKTYLTIGQDFLSIQEYVLSQYNAAHDFYGKVGNSLQGSSDRLPLTYFNPACTMTYTDIYELKGLDKPADYGSGVEYAKGLAEAYPESGLQIGLWLDGSRGSRDIASGDLNDKVYQLFHFIQWELPESLPKIFLRVGYEFDNPWFGYSDDPTAYQEAFRTLVHACETQMTSTICHGKVAFVWHSWAAPRKYDLSLEEFYPGDYYVDWVGISIFQQLFPWANDRNEKEKGENFAGGNILEVREVLEFARARGKPTMIAESTPFGGMRVTESSVARKYIEEDTNNSDIWNLWFQKTIDLIDEYDISMWSYINCDWSSQPMWKDTGFGDTRLSTSKKVMSHWWDQVLRNDTRFLLRIENCYDQLSPSNGKNQGVDELIAQQQVFPENDALKMMLAFEIDEPAMNAFKSCDYLPWLTYTIGISVAILLSAVLLHRSALRSMVKSTSSRALDLPNSNHHRTYGSFEERRAIEGNCVDET